MLARQYRRTFRPLTFDPTSKRPVIALKLMYDLAGTILTMFIINLLSVAFNLLYWKPASTAWAQIYYAHYILGIVGYIFWKLVNPSIRSILKAREVEQRPPTPPLEMEQKPKHA